ncbi:hypothetical protein ACFO8O_14040 [Hephaestia sp. GCM10023244]|uniref:hypothetical protein n=1 Tax=unclassified Hephaestia TaxID=2631281 RepID=UPI0020770322|nr:hypothetical protein [Hephaestia sp. MAHUQ-44]MCM8732083.1 hypothetical protein [Hephaestia sp. MAHUQ-44]
MSRLIALLTACALVLALGLGSIAHAMEPIGCVDAATEAAVGHLEGNTDQNSGGAEAPLHHHGGCHGHHISTTSDGSPSVPHVLTSALAPSHDAAALPGRGAGPALRPPIA